MQAHLPSHALLLLLPLPLNLIMRWFLCLSMTLCLHCRLILLFVMVRWIRGLFRPILNGRWLWLRRKNLRNCHGMATGRHVTVYHMIWATERTHCVIWYGFSEFIEPLNNIGYIVKWLTLPYDMIQWIQWMSMDICLALHHCQGLEWPTTDTYQ